jgi:hypothetical protein
MRLNDGRYECVQCGAVLDIPTDAAPLVTIKTSSGSGAMRTISYQGRDVHSCPLRPAPRRQPA